jgi:transcriptional regulator with XRE-family HTH domain
MPSPRHPRLWLIGPAVRAIREARGITNEQFARDVGISHTHLSKIELTNRQPSAVIIVAIANRLALPVDAITVDLEQLEQLAEQVKAPRGAA